MFMDKPCLEGTEEDAGWNAAHESANQKNIKVGRMFAQTAKTIQKGVEEAICSTAAKFKLLGFSC
jgi:hypothetical protein